MNFFRDRARRGRRPRGFTLVELLVVLVIIGVMAMMIGPSFTTGSDVARVKSASRGVMQLSRYARTMALLHQVPVELVFTSDGRVSVAAVGGGGEGLVSAKAFAVTNVAAQAAAAEEAKAAEEEAAAAAAASGSGGGASYVMADLAVDKAYEQVTFVFEGYTDTMGEGRGLRAAGSQRDDVQGGEADKDDVQTCRVRYKSNGTCRPYRLRVCATGDESCAMTVAIDMLGVAKIEEEE